MDVDANIIFGALIDDSMTDGQVELGSNENTLIVVTVPITVPITVPTNNPVKEKD